MAGAPVSERPCRLLPSQPSPWGTHPWGCGDLNVPLAAWLPCPVLVFGGAPVPAVSLCLWGTVLSPSSTGSVVALGCVTPLLLTGDGSHQTGNTEDKASQGIARVCRKRLPFLFFPLDCF